jgi:hypothetical protein
MKPFFTNIHSVREFRLIKDRYVTFIIDQKEFRRFLKSHRIEKLTLDYGNSSYMYLHREVDRWHFENGIVSFVYMTEIELFEYLNRETPSMINGYIKPFRELDEEKDQLIQISYEGEGEWRVTTTRHSYLAQGYQLEIGDKIK